MTIELKLPLVAPQAATAAAQHPGLVARLQRQLEEWNCALPGYPTRFSAKLGKERP